MDVVDNVGPYAPQSVYAVLDPVGRATAPDTLQRSSLHAMTVSAGAITGAASIWSVPADADANTYAGWYFDAPSSADTGERFVSNFAIYSGSIFANSIIPAAGGCAQGTSNSYMLGVFSGNGGFTSSNSGLLGSPLLVSVGTAVAGTNPNNGLPTKTVTIVPINPGSASLGQGAAVTKQIEVGVRSWREIFSYQSLKN
jgi:hypothetical protein